MNSVKKKSVLHRLQQLWLLSSIEPRVFGATWLFQSILVRSITSKAASMFNTYSKLQKFPARRCPSDLLTRNYTPPCVIRILCLSISFHLKLEFSQPKPNSECDFPQQRAVEQLLWDKTKNSIRMGILQQRNGKNSFRTLLQFWHNCNQIDRRCYFAPFCHCSLLREPLSFGGVLT